MSAEPVCKFEEGCHRVVSCDPGCGATRATAPVDYRLVLSLALGLGTSAPWDVIQDRVRELHTAANGSALRERPCHEIPRDRKIHPAHVYRVQRSESYWCPGLAEPGA